MCHAEILRCSPAPSAVPGEPAHLSCALKQNHGCFAWVPYVASRQHNPWKSTVCRPDDEAFFSALHEQWSQEHPDVPRSVAFEVCEWDVQISGAIYGLLACPCSKYSCNLAAPPLHATLLAVLPCWFPAIARCPVDRDSPQSPRPAQDAAGAFSVFAVTVLSRLLIPDPATSCGKHFAPTIILVPSPQESS